jgi:hypothetical protein
MSIAESKIEGIYARLHRKHTKCVTTVRTAAALRLQSVDPLLIQTDEASLFHSATAIHVTTTR